MRTSAFVACVAALLTGSANAAPGIYYELQQQQQQQQQQPRDVHDANSLVAREPPAATAPWVEVNKNGKPTTTYSPSYTVDGGSTSVVDAAPHDLTATVFTNTWYGEISTSTGDPPNPQPTGKDKKAGAFSRCFNKDGDNAPFCAPARNSTLWVGDTYYVTWDPDFYPSRTNDNRSTEIALRLDWYNRTSEAWDKLTELDSVPAKWGYAPLKVDSKYHKETQMGYTNITLLLLSFANTTQDKEESEVRLPLTFAPHLAPADKAAKAPEGRDLYIALPVVFGCLALLLIGGCLWNRKTRRIQLGNVMGRNKGYTGRSTRRALGLGGGGAPKDDPIHLDVQAVGGAYRDVPDGRPRHSDELGDLVDTPTGDRFPSQGAAGGNAFRDEMDRQRRAREGM